MVSEFFLPLLGAFVSELESSLFTEGLRDDLLELGGEVLALELAPSCLEAWDDLALMLEGLPGAALLDHVAPAATEGAGNPLKLLYSSPDEGRGLGELGVIELGLCLEVLLDFLLESREDQLVSLEGC